MERANLRSLILLVPKPEKRVSRRCHAVVLNQLLGRWMYDDHFSRPNSPMTCLAPFLIVTCPPTYSNRGVRNGKHRKPANPPSYPLPVRLALCELVISPVLLCQPFMQGSKETLPNAPLAPARD